MKIILTGEDGRSFYALFNATKRGAILDSAGICDKENVEILFRPSFGRGAGVSKGKNKCRHSGFGESDALIICKAKDDKTTIVFVEAKKGSVVGDENKNNRIQLDYQFFMKYALIDRILNHKQVGEYYFVEPNDQEEIASILLDFYKKANKGDRPSGIGWLIKKSAEKSPALQRIEKIIKDQTDVKVLEFKFLALGLFGKKVKDKPPIDTLKLKKKLTSTSTKYFEYKNNAFTIHCCHIQIGSEESLDC